MDCDTVHQARVRTPPRWSNPASSPACRFGAQVPVVDDAKTAVVVHGRARLPAVPERQRRAGTEVSRVNAGAAVASRRADDEVVHAAEILIIRGKEQGRLTPDDVLQGLPVIEAEPDQLERVFQVFRNVVRRRVVARGSDPPSGLALRGLSASPGRLYKSPTGNWRSSRTTCPAMPCGFAVAMSADRSRPLQTHSDRASKCGSRRTSVSPSSEPPGQRRPERLQRAHPTPKPSRGRQC
jgi:hypothetical protein